MSQSSHVAQFNIGRMRAPLEDPQMAGFMGRLDEINALAERSPGFVWRLQTEAGNATYLRPYEDERIIVNMSVWESIEQLRAFVYNSDHRELLRQRQQWFEKFEALYLVLWWVPAGCIPSVPEAKMRLEYLQEHGETPHAFTFKTIYPPDAQGEEGARLFPLIPCPATYVGLDMPV